MRRLALPGDTPSAPHYGSSAPNGSGAKAAASNRARLKCNFERKPVLPRCRAKGPCGRAAAQGTQPLARLSPRFRPSGRCAPSFVRRPCRAPCLRPARASRVVPTVTYHAWCCCPLRLSETLARSAGPSRVGGLVVGSLGGLLTALRRGGGPRPRWSALVRAPQRRRQKDQRKKFWREKTWRENRCAATLQDTARKTSVMEGASTKHDAERPGIGAPRRPGRKG